MSGTYPHFGIIDVLSPYTDQGGYDANSIVYRGDGKKVTNSVASTYGDTFTTGDIIGIAVDCTNGAVYFSKNNAWQDSGDPTSGGSKTGSPFTWTGETIDFVATTSPYTGNAICGVNFGQDSSFFGNKTAQ